MGIDYQRILEHTYLHKTQSNTGSIQNTRRDYHVIPMLLGGEENSCFCLPIIHVNLRPPVQPGFHMLGWSRHGSCVHGLYVMQTVFLQADDSGGFHHAGII